MQVDFNADTKAGPRQGKRDELPLPKPLENWFASDLQGVAKDSPAPGEVPLCGYYVVGTWSDLTHCGLMQQEDEEGVYSYTVTTGENNQKLFQIWVDEDNDQIIHPESPLASPNSNVVGPVEKASREMSWASDGRGEQVGKGVADRRQGPRYLPRGVPPAGPRPER